MTLSARDVVHYVLRLSPGYTDARGEIYNVLEREGIQHIGLITCRKGSVRGQHFHKINHQYLFVLRGTFRYMTKDVNTGEVRSAILGPMSLAYTPPFTAHKVVALRTGELLAISTAPRVELQHSDTFPFTVE